MIFLYPESCLH